MTFTPKDWKDRPFGPDAGESLDAYEARLAAYATANPSQVTPIDGAALEDLETRVAGYTDTHSAATTGVHGIAKHVGSGAHHRFAVPVVGAIGPD
jgi:hypothetical protein